MEINVRSSRGSRGAPKAAITLPSTEYANEEKFARGMSVDSAMMWALTRQPVWRSQLEVLHSLSRVKMRPSGEKLSELSGASRGHSKVLSRSRVAASRISIAADLALAMNLLHADHIVPP